MIKINLDYDLTADRKDEYSDLLKDIKPFMPSRFGNM